MANAVDDIDRQIKKLMQERKRISDAHNLVSTDKSSHARKSPSKHAKQASPHDQGKQGNLLPTLISMAAYQ